MADEGLKVREILEALDPMSVVHALGRQATGVRVARRYVDNYTRTRCGLSLAPGSPALSVTSDVTQSGKGVTCPDCLVFKVRQL